MQILNGLLRDTEEKREFHYQHIDFNATEGVFKTTTHNYMYHWHTYNMGIFILTFFDTYFDFVAL